MEQGGGSEPHYGVGSEMRVFAAAAVEEAHTSGESDQPQLVEAASPISSRPPAPTTVNLDEFMSLPEDVGGVGGGAVGVGSGSSSGNRWPRQETLALLKIRSDMDATFRDATLKGPLWEDVSRKLGELGYKRSAKKCKEKFENVQKYYKRTKEGRAGRQDGKSYKFFTQLEALHTTTTATAAASSIPITTSSAIPTINAATVPIPISISAATPSRAPSTSMPMFPTTSSVPTGVISFSSNSSSSSPGTDDDDDDDDDDDEDEEPSNVSRKRKRESKSSKGGSSRNRRMMEFFENLMKQVMQKQEAMQQRFLELIEKREQDRLIREEAWKRQEMARLSREHELMAQERSVSSSRDAAIISFLQKVTGQTIHLPPPVNIPSPPPPLPVLTSAPFMVVPPPPPPPSQQQQQQQQQHRHKEQQVHDHRQSQSGELVVRYQPSVSTDVVMAVPEKQVPPQEFGTGGLGSFDPASSRWPKAEVLALIRIRSGLESRYQEAGPKGPLWEEISKGMQQIGYKRSAKRCKEKWENINKYFKKVKESNKKRPEDAKTCPYFHELDALYRKKVIGSSSTTGSSSSTFHHNQNRPAETQSQQEEQENMIKSDSISAKQPQDRSTSTDQTSVTVPKQQQHLLVKESEIKTTTGASTDHLETSSLGLPSSFFGEGNGGAAKKPEDIVKELMEQQENYQQQQPQVQELIVDDDYDKIEEPDSDDIEQEDEEDDDEDDNDELEYKIEFQRQKSDPSSTEGGNGAASSFMAMVQ